MKRQRDHNGRFVPKDDDDEDGDSDTKTEQSVREKVSKRNS